MSHIFPTYFRISTYRRGNKLFVKSCSQKALNSDKNVILPSRQSCLANIRNDFPLFPLFLFQWESYYLIWLRIGKILIISRSATFLLSAQLSSPSLPISQKRDNIGRLLFKWSQNKTFFAMFLTASRTKGPNWAHER